VGFALFLTCFGLFPIGAKFHSHNEDALNTLNESSFFLRKEAERARWDSPNYLSESFVNHKQMGRWDLNPAPSGGVSRNPLFSMNYSV